jgi:hypothetical protein
VCGAASTVSSVSDQAAAWDALNFLSACPWGLRQLYAHDAQIPPDKLLVTLQVSRRISRSEVVHECGRASEERESVGGGGGVH